MKRLWPWVLALLALIPAFLVHDERPSAPPPVRHTLVLAVFDQPDSLDPANASTTAARLVTDNLFDTLFQVAPNGNLVPDLAQSASVSGNQITINLAPRRLVDGRPVTALMVSESLAHDLWPTTRSPAAPLLAPVSGAAAVAAGQARWISGVQVTGVRQLTITLTHPVANFLYQLASPWLAVLPLRDLAHGGPYWTATDLIGSGGYRLNNWTPGGVMEFTAVGRTGPARVQVVWYPRLSEALLALVNGQVDGMPLPATGWSRVLSNRRVRRDVRFLADGGTVDLVLSATGASLWETPAAAQALGRVNLQAVVHAAFLGQVSANPGALTGLVAGAGAPPPPGPGNGPATVGAPGLAAPLPLTVSSQDMMALRLAEALQHRYPHLVAVTVLSPGAFQAAVASGTTPAVLETVPAGNTATLGGHPATAVALCPAGSFWLLAPGLTGARAFPDGMLDWHALR
jgi:ABC-type transport system substrate-binding protein